MKDRQALKDLVAWRASLEYFLNQRERINLEISKARKEIIRLEKLL